MKTAFPAASPLETEWKALKATVAEGTLLVVRIGDWYEFFYEDAERVNELLGIGLDRRANGLVMAGVSVRTWKFAVQALKEAGCAVALAALATAPKFGERVVRTVTGIV